MTTAIGSITSGASAPAFDPSKGAARFAAKVFSDLDTDKDGTVSAEEQLVYNISHPSATSTDASKLGTQVDQLA